MEIDELNFYKLKQYKRYCERIKKITKDSLNHKVPHKDALILIDEILFDIEVK